MNKIFFLFLLLLASTFSFTSCKQKGCTDPLATNYNSAARDDDGSCVYPDKSALTLNFFPMAGNLPLIYNQEYTVNGRKLKFTRAQFYVSNIALKKNNNSLVYPEIPYALVQSEANAYSIGLCDTGNYAFLEFSIGVDSIANHGDPAQWNTSHPLYVSSPYATYWTWTQGYVFIRLEGYVDSSPDGNGNATTGFAYHIGNDDLLRYVSLALNKNIVAASSAIDLKVDYAKMLENVDFQTELETHTTNNKPLAQKIADKAAEAFSLK